MKIVLIARKTTLDYLVPMFKEEGHEAFLITGHERTTNPIQLLGTDEDKEYVEAFIGQIKPDYVVNAIPGLFIENKTECILLQNTEASSNLELRKRDTKELAITKGFKEIPYLVWETDQFQKKDYVQYIKPISGPAETLKVPANTDPIEFLHRLGNTKYFIEGELEYDVEAWCFFTISNGQYSIIRHIGGTGCGESKLVNNDKHITAAVDDWRQGITLHDLTDDQKTLFLDKCTDWLDYAVTLGGNYEGCIGGYIKDDDVYWSEQNSRPGMQNIGMLPGTAMDWLKGLESDSSLSINQISAATIRSERGWG